MTKKRDIKKPLSRSKCKTSSNKSGQMKSQRLLSCNDVISKSKQLSQKLKTKNNNGVGRLRLRQLNNNEPRICGNGKPMPSLEELEKMFEDSDNDEEKKKPKDNRNQEDMTNNNKPSENPICSTPKKETSSNTDKLNLYSPSTIQAIVDRVTESVNNLTENIPPPPIKPPKKRKKPLVPYIVGCENRPRVPSRPTTSFCKGDDSYGVDSNSSDDEELPTKRAKRTKTVNISKSLFNAKSDEIAARLKELDSLSDKSSDSDKTVTYDVPCSAWPQSFSPEPSTSKCYNVIKKNEMSLNESLIAAEQCNEDQTEILNVKESEQNDNLTATQYNEEQSEILTVTKSNANYCLTAGQCIEDENEILTLTESKENYCLAATQCNEFLAVTECNKNNCSTAGQTDNEDQSKIKIIEQPVDIIVVEEYTQLKKNENKVNNNLSNFDIQVLDNSDNECIEIIQHTPKKCDSPIIVDDYYSSLDLNQTSDDNIVIVDIDDVIAESTAMVKKYRETKDLDIVTLAKPSLSTISEAATVHAVPVPNTPTADCVLVLKANDNTNNLAVHNSKSNNNSGKSNGHNSVCTVTEVDNNPENVLRHFVSMLGKSYVQNMLDDSIITNRNMAQSQQVSMQNSQDTPKSLGECPICMDNFSNKTVASTICGHVFCMTCIESAMKMNGKKCPTCRKALKKNGYHPIFL